MSSQWKARAAYLVPVRRCALLGQPNYSMFSLHHVALVLKTVADGGRCWASDSDDGRLAGAREKTSEAHTWDMGTYTLATAVVQSRGMWTWAQLRAMMHKAKYSTRRGVYAQQSAAVVSAGCELPAYGSAASAGCRTRYRG